MRQNMLFRIKAYSFVFVLLAFKLACTAPVGESVLQQGEKISEAAGAVTPSGPTAEDFSRVENSLRAMKRTEDDFRAEKEIHLVEDSTAKSPARCGFFHKLKVFMRNLLKGIAPCWFDSQSVLTETKAMERDIAAWRALGGGDILLADRYSQEAAELYQKAFELKPKDIQKGDYPKDVLREYPEYRKAKEDLEKVRANYWGLLTFAELEKEVLKLEHKTGERLAIWSQSNTEPTKLKGKFMSDSKKYRRAVDTEVQALKEESAFIDKMILRDHMGAYLKLRKAESLHAQADEYRQAIKKPDKAKIHLRAVENWEQELINRMNLFEKYRSLRNNQGRAMK